MRYFPVGAGDHPGILEGHTFSNMTIGQFSRKNCVDVGSAKAFNTFCSMPCFQGPGTCGGDTSGFTKMAAEVSLAG